MTKMIYEDADYSDDRFEDDDVLFGYGDDC